MLFKENTKYIKELILTIVTQNKQNCQHTGLVFQTEEGVSS